jgi:hypothetical protein
VSRRLYILLLAGLLALVTVAYGFGAALQPLPAAPARASDVPSGYTVSNVRYTLSAGDPRIVGKVTFTLDAAASLAPGATVQAKLIRSSGTYSTCANIPAGSTTWQCQSGGAHVADVDQLAIRVGGPVTTSHTHWLPLLSR